MSDWVANRPATLNSGRVKISTFAIGDVHGCLTALENVISSACITTQDTIVFLGDYVDRGPDTNGVISYVLELASTFNVVTLRGNHEVMMLDARDENEKYFMWQHFGGEETLNSYDLTDGTEWQHCVPENHWQFLEATDRIYETDTHIYVHAGLKPRRALAEQDDAAVFWKKYYKPKKYSKTKVVVCGHTTRIDGEVADFGHTVCIDTFAYGGKWLTCLETETGRYWQADQEGNTSSGSLSDEDQNS